MTIFSSAMVYQFMTGNKPLSILKQIGHKEKVANVTTANCSTAKAIDLKDAKAAPLVKLAVYQQACHSYVTGTVMVFMSMPATTDQAVAYAKEDAVTLKDYAKHNVRPLVIAEPTDKSGAQLDFALAANGSYNAATTTYFNELKAEGITDSQLGIWTPFPEANLPYWKNNEPQYFAPATNNYLTILRAAFPTAQTSVMLNSATYETSDFNWENGDYASLTPFIKGIKPGLVDYAGLQGFPWLARQGGTGAILNAAEFLNPELLKEMADSLGTKKVWFNTGTFQAKYALDPEAKVTMTPERRKAVLTTVNDQALLMQKQGYQVAVNIFAQDKSKDSEETDWSYWQGNLPFNSTSTPVITDFIGQLNQEKIDFWLFDR